jgi:hypothetical protein
MLSGLLLRVGSRAKQSVRQSGRVLLQQHQHKKQTRQLHACWSVLLSHEWMLIGDDVVLSSGGITTSDDPGADPSLRTVLLLHDAFGCRQDCEDLATQLITAGTGAGAGQGIQCLLVDLR